MKYSEHFKPKVGWSDQEYQTLVTELRRHLSKETYHEATFSLCSGGRSAVQVFHLMLEDEQKHTYSLIIRSHPTLESARREVANAKKIGGQGVNSLDDFLHLVAGPIELAPNRSIVVYEDVTVNKAGEFVESLDKSLLHYFTATAPQRDTWVSNFQGFIQRVTKSYENVEKTGYHSLKSEHFCHDCAKLLAQLPPDMMVQPGAYRLEIISAGSEAVVVETTAVKPSDEVSPVAIDTVWQSLPSKERWANLPPWLAIQEKCCLLGPTPILTGNGATAYIPLQVTLDPPSPPLLIWLGVDKTQESVLRAKLTKDQDLEYQVTVQTTGVTSLTTALQQMGFDSQTCLATADFQALCQTIGLIHTDFRHNDLHCGNVLVSQDAFKVIDVGDMEESLIASDIARLETSLWFELAAQFSLEEAEEVVKRLGKPQGDWLPSKSDRVEAFSLLLSHLYQGFQAVISDQRLAEEQRKLAYLLQILLYQRYWLLDGVAEVPPALKVFVAHHLKFWHPRLRKLPPKPLKLHDCVNEGLSRLESSLLAQLPVVTVDLPAIPRDGWPMPVQTVLDKNHLHLQDYLHVFEALVHLHWVTLASQFYWALPRETELPGEALTAGLRMLHQSLTQEVCEGGMTWLYRSAVLSVAYAQLPPANPLPFPALPEILEPTTLVLGTAAKDTTGGAGWTWLRAMAEIRQQVGTCQPIPLMAFRQASRVEDGLLALLDRLGEMFKPYHGLDLAMVSETPVENGEVQRGIHCSWQGTKFLCVSERLNQRHLRQIWQAPAPSNNPQLIPAPMPPRLDWQWEDSLVLYEAHQPYTRYLYLMPLGSCYHQRPECQPDKRWPGLLDSVRWKQQRPVGVLQRHYQDDLPPLGWQRGKTDAEIAHGQNVKQNIEKLVKELCENFGFTRPETSVTAETAEEIRPQFDLGHDKIARQWASNKVLRQSESQRVLALLKDSPAQRLLLEGESGSGKTVLLGQLFLQLEQRAVFVSLDAKIEGLQDLTTFQKLSNLQDLTTFKPSIGLRVAMHCLTVLNQLSGLPLPTMVLSLPQVQQQLRDNLTHLAQRDNHEDWFILLDGLNQATDPGGITSGFPDPLPPHLYVLASSQRQDRVWQPLTRYGHETWQRADIDRLAKEEATAIIQHYWTEENSARPRPALPSLPEAVLDQVIQVSHGVPVFLEDWTKWLRELWSTHPQDFTAVALAEMTQQAQHRLPKFLVQRLEEAKRGFTPPQLLEALLWCFSLIPKGLSLAELQQGVAALRQLEAFATVPPVSKQQIGDGLFQNSQLGGFLRPLVGGAEERWQLSHEVVATWFIDQYGKSEELPLIRLQLVKLGAIPLPENATQAEVAQWLEWMQQENYEHYRSLPDVLLVSVCESLRARLPEKSPERALVLAHLAGHFLSGTGEQQRGFALESALEQTLQQSTLSLSVQAEVLGSLGDIQKSLNRLDKALEYFKRYLAIREQLLKETDTPHNRREVATAWNRVGGIYEAQNDLDQALACYQRSLDMRQALLTESPTPQTRRDVALAWHRMGGIYQAQNDLVQALACQQRYLEISQALLSESPTPQTRRDVALAWNRVGGIYEAQNDLVQALACYQRSLDIFQALLSESPTPQTRRDVALAWHRVGGIYEAQNDLVQALACQQRYLEISQALLSESPTPQTRRDVAVAWNRVGGIYAAQNDLVQALACQQRYLEISQALLSESPTPQTRRDVAVAWNRVGGIYAAQNDLVQALACHQRSLDMRQALLTESPTPQTRHDMAVAQVRLGRLYVKQQHFDQAQSYLEAGLHALESLLVSAPLPLYRQEVEVVKGELLQLSLFEKDKDNQVEEKVSLWERLKRWLRR